MKQIIRDRKIFKKGASVKANLIFAKIPRDKTYKSSPSTLYVEFFIGNGEKHETIVSCNNEWLVNQLKYGSELNVIYLPEAPKEEIILEAYMR